MAKRIKVKSKAPRINNRPPRGLSKAERVMSNAEDQNYRRGGDPGIFGGQLTSRELIEEMRLGRGATRPSSTRKKRVKEGRRKFIGPRQFENVDKEEAANEFGIRPHPSRNYGWKANIRGAQFKEDSRPDFDSIGSERLKEMLMNILYKRGLAMPF